jgi:hypothetical protein
MLNIELLRQYTKVIYAIQTMRIDIQAIFYESLFPFLSVPQACLV